MRDVVGTHYDEYNSTRGRGAKAGIAERVVNAIYQKGGKFLKLDESTDWWIPVSAKEAQEKVLQSFRKHRAKATEVTVLNVKGIKNSTKRAKVQKPSDVSVTTTTETVTAESSSPIYDFKLDENDLAYLLEGHPIPECPDEDLLLGDHDPQSKEGELEIDPLPFDHDPLADKGLLGIDIEVATMLSDNVQDPLLKFLDCNRDCLKCTPQETLKWLHSEDISNLADLREACSDDDFIDLELKRKGGLKGFKRHPFVKALMNITSG